MSFSFGYDRRRAVPGYWKGRGRAGMRGFGETTWTCPGSAPGSYYDAALGMCVLPVQPLPGGGCPVGTFMNSAQGVCVMEQGPVTVTTLPDPPPTGGTGTGIKQCEAPDVLVNGHCVTPNGGGGGPGPGPGPMPTPKGGGGGGGGGTQKAGLFDGLPSWAPWAAAGAGGLLLLVALSKKKATPNRRRRA